jgi:hypothetical protein
MARFLVEVEHETEELACLRAIEILLKTGSHFLTNADWGCLDGQHKAWILVEVESKEEALRIVPPAYRNRAKAVQLTKFTLEDIAQMRAKHKSDAS